MNTKNVKSRRTRKIAAVTSALLAVGLGATYTLASWNDSEWVWGGADGGGPGVGTSSFNVQQDASSPFAAPGTFGDHDTNPGDSLTFSAGALSLTPGDKTYAPVALRTATPSAAGDVVLQGAVAAAGVTVTDAGSELWNAVRVDVYTSESATPPSACSPSFSAAGWTQVLTDAPLGDVADGPQSLAADSGSTQHYCFVLTLPDDAPTTLQGRTIAPAWEFRSVSS